jgi:predicted DNA-binding protein (MmcQ/YjbR family)
MNVDQLREYCMGFPEATENVQWGDDLCFKVRGKIFAITGLAAFPHKVCCKCTPETFAELTERPDIRPAPYVGRYKWVLLDGLNAVRGDELRELIRQSYEMVAAKAPKAGTVASRKKKPTAKKSARQRARSRKH